MRVSRSLTIKHMAMVFGVATVFIAIFIVTLLFHFVQQSRYTTANQMESIARSVRAPLSAAILKADISQAEQILNEIPASGIVGRADVVLPNQFQALRVSFVPERAVPMLMSRLFELPVQITLPLYSLERPANPQPLAYLVLQADSWRVYRFIASTLSTLLITYLLLVLVVTIAVTWSINRLMVHPIRHLARALHDYHPQQNPGHQLKCPALHQDDEIGLLVRSYNRNQLTLKRMLDEKDTLSTRHPISGLPNRALLLALLEQELAGANPFALLIVSSGTLQESAGVLNEEQRAALIGTVVERIRLLLPQNAVFAQLSMYDFAIILRGIRDAWKAMALAQQIIAKMNEKLMLQGIHLRPVASIGIAMSVVDNSAEQMYRRAVSATSASARLGKNQIQFFDPEQMASAQLRLTQESDIISALENDRFAIWLQPQVSVHDGHIVSAEVLLRERQEDGSWMLSEGLMERIESCGLMITVGNWVLENSVRLLASWQAQGFTLPLSVNLSALQLVQFERVDYLTELLRRYHVQPGSLILEVTESRRIDDPESAVNILRPLRQAGVRIALNDFGMGYASLHQLHPMKSIPVDILKIDKMFVEGLPSDGSMVSLILAMARNLGLEVVAKGVENEAQRDWLESAGVTIVQGLLYSKALPPDAFAECYLQSPDKSATHSKRL